jgi:hypothetical protein
VRVVGSKTLEAFFLSTLDVIYVDDDAASDPGPGDISVSDPAENGTKEHPFDSIQQAIFLAQPKGVKFVVLSGHYTETLDFMGKAVEVTSAADPNAACEFSFPVIDADDAGTVVNFISGEDANSMLKGFVLTRGKGEIAGAVFCSNSSPTLTNCIIVGNRATVDQDGAAVYCSNSSASIVNCTITDNYGGHGAAVVGIDSNLLVRNTIMWDNIPLVSQRIIALPLEYYYNDLMHTSVQRNGNISMDPEFAAHGMWVDVNDQSVVVAPDNPGAIWVSGDYHLKSQAGRWDSVAGQWVTDDTTSACIDAADPQTTWQAEAKSNGSRANMGAYGCTPQASKSSSSNQVATGVECCTSQGQ